MQDQNKNNNLNIDNNVDTLMNILKKHNSETPPAPASNGLPKAPESTKKQPSVAPHGTSETAPRTVQTTKAPASARNHTPDTGAFGDKTPPSPARSNIKKSVTSTKTHVINFDDIDPENARKRRSKMFKTRVNSGKNAFVGLLKTVIYLVIVIFVSIFLATTVINIANDIYAFEKGDINVEVTIPAGATTNDVAKILKENGIIKYPSVFKFYAEREFKSSKYYDGTYKSGNIAFLFMNKSAEEETPENSENYTEYLQLSQQEDASKKILNYDRIIALVAHSNYKARETVRVTIPEGYTADEIINLLVSNGVGTREKYIDAIQNYEYDYRFVKEIIPGADRKYRLEGYLFPDTYDFFTDESEISVINKMLSNFEVKFEDVYYERADELNMTVDELVTLASILQKEARFAQDFPLMSSVFHHRLDDNYRLESDATILYVINDYESESAAQQSPYNSYKTAGMIPGPISNPGIEAISAAFYPEKTNYYYFFSLKNGNTVYSRTHNEHTTKLNKAKSEGTYAS